ncbi:uncharacterized protein K452DRAFT_309614 [Aplosporella prunicola CBS 121167]|uniref:Peptidase S8/S53 domain-containing protein n=1 Tax=Aplosporella prunicola CBS 121167 TaxID=1176127 RepID=A0A6A6BDB2_9PEZI|nr:uncharacterized protein K452DRAFT_309614 [Aplosporella prunicola CBS 121167]KAF2140461.1 hypothetical protein K452DRAFT_309614 [Aplosporella prunicola CBS 121167]
MSETDSWLQRLEAHVHSVIDKHYSDKNGDDIKIALLDTGVARPIKLHMESEDLKDNIMAMNQRVKRGVVLGEGLKPNEDIDGHGTDCAYLLWKVCPYAEIYPYRICMSKEEPEVKIVKKALEHAVHEHKVDIISISVGWDRASFQLREVFKQASKSSILLFGATLDDGRGIKYPARDDAVIAIDAADIRGEPQLTSPKRGLNRQCYTAVGRNITSIANFRAAPKPLDELQQK